MKFFINLCILLAVFVGGIWASDYVPERWLDPNEWLSMETLSREQAVSANKLNQVYETLQNEYLYQDQLSEVSQLESGAAKGFVNALEDPYTRYFSQKNFEEFQKSLKGKFEGIGARIGIRNDNLVVISPLEGMPAQEAGLQSGDQIIAIDETSTVDMSVDRAVTLIRGKKGTDVTLTIKREGERETQEITITRGEITVPDVKGSVKDGVAHVEITQFKRNTASNVKSEVATLLNQTENNTVVLDLRNNGGGILSAAVETIGLFVERDSVAVQEKKRGGTVEKLRTSRIPEFKDVEVVALTNQASASAAEIVAGGLRDLRGVSIVGKQTFGKGSVQEVKRFPDGSALKVTVAEWLTPNGTNINEEGLKPDITVERSEEDINDGKDPQLQRALKEVKEE